MTWWRSELIYEEYDINRMTWWKSEIIYEEYDISLSTSHFISVDMLVLPCLPSSKRPAPPLDNCYLCAKFEPNQRGRRFFEYLPEYLPRHLIASGV